MSTITTEVPDSVFDAMHLLAKSEGMPVERLAAFAITQAVGAWSNQHEVYAARAARGDRAKFEAVMNKVPSKPPVVGDE